MTIDPTEAQIEKVLATYTPRQIAIAYLRAKATARSANLAFDMMSDVADFTRTALSGDLDGAKAAVESIKKHTRTSKQISEGIE